jgi:VCBS repeat-containing protein
MVSFDKTDLVHILAQIRLAESGQPANPQLAFGLRTVDGTNNSLIAGTTAFGSADQAFPRVTAPVFGSTTVPAGTFGPGSPAVTTSYSQSTGNVYDTQPRTISNLISDQTLGNAAAVQAALQSLGNADPAAGAQAVVDANATKHATAAAALAAHALEVTTQITLTASNAAAAVAAQVASAAQADANAAAIAANAATAADDQAASALATLNALLDNSTATQQQIATAQAASDAATQAANATDAAALQESAFTAATNAGLAAAAASAATNQAAEDAAAHANAVAASATATSAALAAQDLQNSAQATLAASLAVAETAAQAEVAAQALANAAADAASAAAAADALAATTLSTLDALVASGTATPEEIAAAQAAFDAATLAANATDAAALQATAQTAAADAATASTAHTNLASQAFDDNTAYLGAVAANTDAQAAAQSANALETSTQTTLTASNAAATAAAQAASAAQALASAAASAASAAAAADDLAASALATLTALLDNSTATQQQIAEAQAASDAATLTANATDAAALLSSAFTAATNAGLASGASTTAAAQAAADATAHTDAAAASAAATTAAHIADVAFTNLLTSMGITEENGSLVILNVTPDAGLSAPFNTWMTLFGQFFDHGLDLVTKASSAGTVFIPLLPDDPLYVPGGHSNFMVLTRSVKDAGADGILGTADDVNSAGTNTITAFVDQSQTYTSHPSHQVFLREYQIGSDGLLHSTGHMLDHVSADGSHHMPTWADVKANALSLGISLTDADINNIPLLATDAYGNFIPGANGHVQMVKLVGGVQTLVEADPAAPINTAGAVSTQHAFLNDISHNANPYTNAGVLLAADTDTVAGNAVAFNPLTGDNLQYDNELLNAHYIAGDGRVNENIGLTAVHEVFHLEHNRLIEQTKDVVRAELANGDTAFASEWVLAGANLADGIQENEWNGERLFQTAKFGTETQYQHLVFEEFARKVAPTIHLFGNLQINLDPAITAEFAHAVYRFGHSMLDENVNRYVIGADGTPLMDANGNPTLNPIGLIDAFLNPLAFASQGADAAGQIVLGSVNQVGNEIDEFVTGALRNNLLGLPLDLAALNIARGRETGVAPLNLLRNQIFSQTHDTNLQAYESWDDFGQFLKHSGSLVNFVAAYGTHSSITSAVTLVDKRAAALDLVTRGTLGNANFDQDAFDFIHSQGVYANDATHTNALAQHSQWSTGSITGLDNVDLWIGGLAEKQNLFGGLLGSTFNFIFETQLERLQDADRLYYLPRVEGLHWGTQIEGNSFAEMIMGNTGTHHLSASIFLTPEYVVEARTIDKNDPSTWLREPTLPGADGILGTADDIQGKLLVDVLNDGTIRFLGHDNFLGNTMVLGGTEGDDRLLAGQADDDTVWGDGGNDHLDGGNGNDFIYGGTGDDTITDSAGNDVMHGDEGNDNIDGGMGDDIILGGDGNDFINGGAGLDAVNGGLGNDVIMGGEDDDELLGNEGDDWLEGGAGGDLLNGDSGAPTGQTPLFAGNDVLIGGAGGDRMHGFNGDDIIVGEGGFDVMLGDLGWDWASFDGLALGVDIDMTLVDLVAGVPVAAADAIRTRFIGVEAASGTSHNDIIRGTNVSIADQFNELNNPNLILGLTDILGQSSAALGLYSYSAIGPVAMSNGNILLGGGGSDLFQGRAGDDIIDGDAALHVSLTTFTDADGVTVREISREITNDGHAGDIDTAFYAGSIDQYTINEMGVRYDPTLIGSDLFGNPLYVANGVDEFGNPAVLDGTGNPVIDPFTGSPALPGDFIFDADFLNAHLIGSGVFHVTDNGAPAALGVAGILGTARDGSDTLRNIERIEFGTFDATHARYLDLGLRSVAGVTHNNVPGGSLTIAGDANLALAGIQPAVGVPLSVVDAISDPDGTVPGSMRYQWEAADLLKGQFVEIAGATAATFMPTNDFLGQPIRVHASYVDGTGFTETVYSLPTDAVTAGLGTNTAPTFVTVINGLPDTVARQGVLLNQFLPLLTTYTDAQTPVTQLAYSAVLASNGQVLDGSAAAYGLNFVLITDPTTGLLTGANVTGIPQVFGNIDVRVLVTDPGNLTLTDVFRISVLQPTATSGIAPVPVPLRTVVIDDTTPMEDQVLTASQVFAPTNNVNASTLTYTWQVDNGGVWTDLAPASASATFQPGQAQVGHSLRAIANYDETTGAHLHRTVTSGATLAVENVNDLPVGLPRPIGIARQGETLSVDVSGISDEDGIATPFHYFWTRGNVAILDNRGRFYAGSTYTLANADVGSQIGVVVDYTDAFGTHEYTDYFTRPLTAVVANINDAPVLDFQATLVGAQENAAFFVATADLLQGIRDPDVGETATLTVSTPTADFGVVTVVADGYSIMPTPGFNGTMTLDYIVSDIHGATLPVSLQYFVDGVNDAPIVVAPLVDLSTLEDAAFSLNTAPAFFDVDAGDVLTYSATQVDGTDLPLWLTIDPTTGVLSGTPLNGDVGEVHVRVTATDIGLLSVFSEFILTVTNTNDAPTVVAALLEQSTAEDAVFSLNTTTAFLDVDVGDVLTYSATQLDGTALPTWLSIDPGIGLLSGTPLNGDVGAINVRVTVTDAALTSASSDFTLTVTNTNDVPTVVAALVAQSTAEDAAFSLNTAPAFLDVDVGDVLTYSATLVDGTALPTWLSIDPTTGLLSGTPLNADVGAIDVRVTATDVALTSTFSDFTLTVTNTNDAPVAVADTGTAVEAGAVAGSDAVGNVLLNDTDVDVGDSKTVTTIGAQVGAHGTLTLSADGGYSYAVNNADTAVNALHLASDTLTDSFSYTMRDTAGATSTSNLVVTIQGSNDAPLAAPVTLAAIAEDSSPRIITSAQLLAGVTDVDGPPASITSLTIGTGNGTLVNNIDGSWTYTPVLNDDTAVSFNYTASDGSLSASSTAALDITPVADPTTGSVNIDNTSPDLLRTVTADASSLADVDGTLVVTGYQWQSSSDGNTWGDVAGATGASFTTDTAGVQLRVQANYSVGGGATESIFSAATAAVGAFHLITGTNAGETLNGTAVADQITALSGNDVLIGGTGADRLIGGLGNDTYEVREAGDQVVENAGEGTDTVWAYVDYSLSADVENLVFSSAIGNMTGTGNALNNLIIGSNGNDLLIGGGGNDILRGGTGNDTYEVREAGDVVQENANAGTDTVLAYVNHTLGANVENLDFSGAVGNMTGTGNALDNLIIGSNGNDVLIGGGGADSLRGGLGNDTYEVREAGDVVVENAGAGTDTVWAYLNYTLGADAENLVFSGAIGNMTGTGNALNNLIIGSNGNDVLIGGGGNDILRGGTGNDTYEVREAGDVVQENANAGTDSVSAYVNHTLGANVENLDFSSAVGNMVGTGNGLDNTITGSNGNDTLSGGGGADTLVGGLGRDVLTGGGGADTFVLRSVAESGTTGATRDVIADFLSSTDKIDFTGIDANTGAAGDQAFSMIGTIGFTGLAGQLRYQSAGTDTVLMGDVNGDGVADFHLVLTGNQTFVAADLLL